MLKIVAAAVRRRNRTWRAPFYGTRQVSPPVNRLYGADRQRFAVTPGEDGGSVLTLDENESVTVGTGDEGSLGITINTKPEPENGDGDDAGSNGVDVEPMVSNSAALKPTRENAPQ
jgi:hypothetical protein